MFSETKKLHKEQITATDYRKVIFISSIFLNNLLFIMNRIIPILLVFSLSIWIQDSRAQNVEEQFVEVQITHAQKVGTTIPIRDKERLTEPLVHKSKAVKAKRKAEAKEKGIVLNFMEHEPYVSPNPNALPLGEDKVRQKGSLKNMALDIEPLVNVRGQTTADLTPHDPSGDIGKEYYLQAVNGTYLAVYDKLGFLLDSFTTDDLWASFGYSSGVDPIVLYDQEVERWLITGVSLSLANVLLVAISEDNDPLGTWDIYEFGTLQFPDYPKYSVWPNAYTITTNEQSNNASPAYFMDKAALLNGDDIVEVQRLQIPTITSGPLFQVDSPVDWTGSTPPPANQGPMLVSMVDDAWGLELEDRIDVHQINIDWGNPDNTSITTIEIPTTPFDSEACSVGVGVGQACIPQMGTDEGIDGIPTVIYNQVHYRNFTSHESIVLCFAVDAGNDISGIRWMELRRLPGEDWTLYQEGTIAPDDGLHRVLACIAIDFEGNIALVYNISGENDYPGTRLTGRRASDPLGEMTINEYVVVEGTNPLENVRFGDYSHMTVDPLDERTFWFTTEYGGGADVEEGIGSTRIAAFMINRDTVDIGPFAILAPQSSDELGDNEIVKIQVRNFGEETVNSFQVGYSFDGGEPIIEDVVYELPKDSVYIHNFATTVDMSMVGDYTLNVFTVLEDDQGAFNNVYERTISKFSSIDAGVSQFRNLEALSCSENAEVGITNYGVSELTSVEVVIHINNVVTNIVDWTGNLLKGETGFVSFPAYLIVDGNNTIYATTINPNGVDDEIPENNSFTRDFDVDLDRSPIILELQTDDYPGETTWEIVSNDGSISYQGGPYGQANSPFAETWCLDKDLCYTFTIYDAYGDGICCDFGQGAYEVVDSLGNVIVSGGEFGSEEIQEFCFDYLCTLEAEIDVSPESELEAGDGAIMITAMNGEGPYQYSIDGGETFQDESLFTDLSQGVFDVVVVGTDEICAYEITVELFACTMDIVIETTQETTGDSDDGQIIITVNNGNDPVGYSIDGGETFQDENVFDGLGAGEYDVVVKDAGDCTIEETVTVSACALDVDIEIVSSPSNEGSLVITVNNGEEPYQYSLTGIVFQTNNTFSGLPAGDYNIIVIDALGCQYESTVTLDDCSLEASIEITPSNGSDGAISITSTGGVSPIQYSIDGGETFQDSPDFTGLSAGDYSIVIKDADNCQIMDNVSLNVTGINDLVYGYSIDVMPNPTDGLFKINITGFQNDNDVFLPFEVYDTQGKLLQSAKLVKYDGIYTGPVSLEYNPAGIYYVRFLDSRINRMVRVVKSK